MNKKIIFCISVIVIIGFVSIFVWKYNEIPTSEREIVKNCEGLNLKKTAFCLVENIETFFVYNGSNIPESFNSLKEYGGICGDWADLYISLGDKLGFFTESLTMRITNIEGHRIAIISNDEGFCILDQTSKPLCNSLYVNSQGKTIEDVRKDLRDYVREEFKE